MSFSMGMCGLFIFMLLSVTASVLQLIPSLIISKFTMMDLAQQQDETNAWYMYTFAGSIVAYVTIVFLRSCVW